MRSRSKTYRSRRLERKYLPERGYHRGHMVFGALCGALLPYVYGASLHGPLLGRSTEIVIIFAGLMAFFALLGAGVATRNFGKGPIPFDHDEDDRQTRDRLLGWGIYTENADYIGDTH